MVARIQLGPEIMVKPTGLSFPKIISRGADWCSPAKIGMATMLPES